MSTTPQKVYSDFEDKICRLCASTKDYYSINIFGSAGQRKKIREKIFEFLNISISEEDGFPSKICRQCDGVLKRFSEFKTMAIDTQEQLKSKITAKRCKVFSPVGCEPTKKVRVVEKLPSARSLPFNNNIASSVQQSTSQKSQEERVTEIGPGEKSGCTILSQAGLRNPEVSLKG